MAGVVKNAEFEAKHRRGTHGRFGPGTSKPKLLKRDERAVADIGESFAPHHIASPDHARAYTAGQKRRIRPETVAAFHDIAAKLRRRDASDERVGKLDAAMAPTEHDLVLTRHMPVAAFGLGEEDLGRLPELLAGRKIVDRAYVPAALHQEGRPGGVTMHIAVPKGTRALVAGDNEVWLDRDLELAVLDVHPNGRGGYDVRLAALPKAGPRSKSTPKTVKKAMPAKKASEAKLTPAQELQRWRADAAKPGRVASKATGPTKREEYTTSWQDRIGQIEAEIARVEADGNDPGAKKPMLDRLRADLKYYVGARDALRANPDSTLDEPAAGITYELAQKVDPARPLAVYGDILHMEGSDDSWTHVNMAELEKIPAELHGVAAAHMAQRDTGGVWVGDKSVVEMDDSQDLAGEQPRGWGPGGTFEQVNGVYRPERRAMLVGRTANSAHRGAATASHEFGHALDDALGGASRTLEWGALHDRVLATADHRLSPYFKQPGTAGRSEFWAEALSVWASAYREPDQQRRVDAYRVRFGMPLDVARDIHAYFDRVAQQHSGG